MAEYPVVRSNRSCANTTKMTAVKVSSTAEIAASLKSVPLMLILYSWVDRVLPHLASPDVLVHDRLSELEVVVRGQAGTGVHHQVGHRPQVAGDRLPAAGPPAGAALGVDAGQVVREHVRIAGAEHRGTGHQRVPVTAQGTGEFRCGVVVITDGA